MCQDSRQVAWLYDLYLDDDDNIIRIRHTFWAKKKKAGLDPRDKIFKFGIEVHRTLTETIKLDAANGDNALSVAIKKEMKLLNF